MSCRCIRKTGKGRAENRPEICFTCDQTCDIGEQRFKRSTYRRQEARLASKIVRRAAALALLKATRFSEVAWRSNALEARLRALIALRHSSVHHGTGMRWGAPEVRGMDLLVASRQYWKNLPLMEWSRWPTRRRMHLRRMSQTPPISPSGDSTALVAHQVTRCPGTSAIPGNGRFPSGPHQHAT